MGGAVAGLPKPGTVPRAAGVSTAGSGIVKALSSVAPKPPKLGAAAAAGVDSAGSSLSAPSLASKLGQPTGAAAAPQPTSAAAPISGGSDLDSTYYNNVADYLFKTQNTINNDQYTIGTDQNALQSALGQLNYAQPRAALAAEQKSNLAGGLFSSAEQQGQADLAQKYLTARTNDTTKYDTAIQKLSDAIAGLQAGIPLYENAQAEASATRAAAAAQKNPAQAAPPAPAAAAAAPAAAAPAAARNPASGVATAGSALTSKAANNLAKGIAKPAKKPTKSIYDNLLK